MKKFLLLLPLLLIIGCTKTEYVNSLYQEDYDGNCFVENITWSEMSLCLKNDRDKEWAQNKIVNNLNNPISELKK